ncbi:MAG: NFACT family protein [Candidatus Diapherotrites archaeon]
MFEPISHDKLNIPSQSFSALIKYLKGENIEQSTVKKVQEMPKGAIKIKLYTKAGEKDLVICSKYFFISKYQLPAKQQTSGFGAFLNKHLRSKRLISIEQLGSERVFILNFSDYFLFLELFSKGNIILTDKSKRILGCLHAEEWSTREIKKGLQYKEPPSTIELDKISAGEFVKLANKDAGIKIVPWLVKSFGLAPIIAETSSLEANIEPEKTIENIPEQKLRELHEKITLNSKKSDPEGKAYILEHRSSFYLLPFLPPPFSRAHKQEFKNLNDALNEIFVMQKEPKAKSENVDKKATELKNVLEKQITKVKSCEKASLELKAKARAIYDNFNDVCSAFEFARAEIQGKKGKEQVMYSRPFGNVLLKSIDFSKRSAKIELIAGENRQSKEEC